MYIILCTFHEYIHKFKIYETYILQLKYKSLKHKLERKSLGCTVKPVTRGHVNKFPYMTGVPSSQVHLNIGILCYKQYIPNVVAKSKYCNCPKERLGAHLTGELNRASAYSSQALF